MYMKTHNGKTFNLKNIKPGQEKKLLSFPGFQFNKH